MREEQNKREAEEIALRSAEADRSARQRDRLESLAVESRKDRKQSCLGYFAEHLLVECLIVDSRIWIGDEYGAFFYVLEEACREKGGYRVTLAAEQFDEICGLDVDTGHGSQASPRIRLAVERIEQLQKKNLLTLQRAAPDSERPADRTSLAIRLIDAAVKAKKVVALVTDDRELRIEARRYLYRSQDAKIEIVNIESLIADCREVQATDLSFRPADDR